MRSSNIQPQERWLFRAWRSVLECHFMLDQFAWESAIVGTKEVTMGWANARRHFALAGTLGTPRLSIYTREYMDAWERRSLEVSIAFWKLT